MRICRTCGHDLPSSFFQGDDGRCPACRSGYAKLATAHENASGPLTQPQAVTRRRYPPVTTALMAINTAVWLLMVFRGVSPINPDALRLLDWGANYGPLALASQPWRMLTSNY